MADRKEPTAFQRGESAARDRRDVGSNPYRGSQLSHREFITGYQAQQARVHGFEKESPLP